MAASGRQYTSQTTCRWHPIATGVVRHIESVSTLSRPEWPSWPFSPSAWMQESSELLPATGPRAARGRTDAAEAVGCADLAPTNLAPLTSKINPPPFAIQQHVQPAPRRKLGRWPTTITLLAGTFWPRRLMAGYRITPVLVFWTKREINWVKFTFETGFELPSSWSNLPCYGVNLNRNILDFMK